MTLKNINPSKTNDWVMLKKHANIIKHYTLKKLFKKDINRFNKFSIKFNDIFLDFSKNHIVEDTLLLLCNLAESCCLRQAIKKMFLGNKINKTENRGVLHTLLRNKYINSFVYQKRNIYPEINNLFNKIKNFTNDILRGHWTGYTNKKITDIVNIGIGGSDLGPSMVTEALKYYKTDLNIHFVSNIDYSNIFHVIDSLNPETTLFIVSSKTFTTEETMTNADTAKKWFLKYAVDKKYILKHFIAISTNLEAVKKFGIESKNNIFQFWDWVGGRFSIWGAIGLTISLSIGFKNFTNFLTGAYDMDCHFKTSDFRYNIPVILALINIWYINFFNINVHLILPYNNYLKLLPDYMQQLDMESNGKYIDRNGNFLDYRTGPLIFGGVGTNVQHSFFQYLHQGTSLCTSDFLISLFPLHDFGDHDIKLFSNFLAQTRALAFGNTNVNNNKKFIFNYYSGNKCSNSIIFKKLTPYVLGSIISMYEHKIFTQGVIWNIFSFDQWGVELGKRISKDIFNVLKNNISNNFDSSTNGLINIFFRKNSLF